MSETYGANCAAEAGAEGDLWPGNEPSAVLCSTATLRGTVFARHPDASPQQWSID